MGKQDRIPTNPQQSLGPIHRAVGVEVQREAVSVTDLFTRTLEENETLALRIRRQAHGEAGDDLVATEQITRAALEALEIEKRKLTIERLNRIFNGPSM